MSNSWAEREAWGTRPRRVEGGIRIASTRGPIATSWWSRRFVEVLEGLGVGGRLARGRSYARAGQVVALTVQPGAAVATVQGSAVRPYRVRIGVGTFGRAEWAALVDSLAADAWLTASLLAGEMPREIEEVAAGLGLALFPAGPADLTLDCTCPDAAVVCKHLAAACYLLAERFDAEPFAVLTLRGRDRETLLAALRARRGADAAAAAAPPLEGWFAAGPLPTREPGPAAPPGALLGEVPALALRVRGVPLAEVLRPAYEVLGEG